MAYRRMDAVLRGQLRDLEERIPAVRDELAAAEAGVKAAERAFTAADRRVQRLERQLEEARSARDTARRERYEARRLRDRVAVRLERMLRRAEDVRRRIWWRLTTANAGPRHQPPPPVRPQAAATGAGRRNDEVPGAVQQLVKSSFITGYPDPRAAGVGGAVMELSPAIRDMVAQRARQMLRQAVREAVRRVLDNPSLTAKIGLVLIAAGIAFLSAALALIVAGLVLLGIAVVRSLRSRKS